MNNNFINFLKSKKINFTIGGRSGLHLHNITSIPLRYIEIDINKKDIKGLDSDGGLILTDGRPVLVTLTEKPCTKILKDKDTCIKESIDVETFNKLLLYVKTVNNIKNKLSLLKYLIEYNPQDKEAINYFYTISDNSDASLHLADIIKKYRKTPIILAKKCFYRNIGDLLPKSVKYSIVNGIIDIQPFVKLDFVIDKYHSLNIGLDHSFLSKYSGFVFGAGTVELRDNILHITNASGHYMPTDKQMDYALQYFRQLRIKNIVYENIQV